MAQGEQVDDLKDAEMRRRAIGSLRRLGFLISNGAGPVVVGMELTFLVGTYGYELKPTVGECVNSVDQRTVNN